LVELQVTGTTVGYGDVTPLSQAGRLLAVVYMPVAVIFVNTMLSDMDAAILGATAGNSKLEKLMASDLSLEGMLKMDDDGDGSITEFEFLRFMLTRGGMADEALLDTLHARFTEMDKDGSGALSKADLRVEPLGVPREGAKPPTKKMVAAASKGWFKELRKVYPEMGEDGKIRHRTRVGSLSLELVSGPVSGIGAGIGGRLSSSFGMGRRPSATASVGQGEKTTAPLLPLPAGPSGSSEAARPSEDWVDVEAPPPPEPPDALGVPEAAPERAASSATDEPPKEKRKPPKRPAGSRDPGRRGPDASGSSSGEGDATTGIRRSVSKERAPRNVSKRYEAAGSVTGSAGPKSQLSESAQKPNSRGSNSTK
jgi:Ca2+-binding EF-hand superfamily protein